MSDWEKEFEKRWSGDKCPAYQAFEDPDKPGFVRDNIKDFIKNWILPQERNRVFQETIKQMEGVIGKDDFEQKVFISRDLEDTIYAARNVLRAQQRKRLAALQAEGIKDL